ncbi:MULTISPECIES: EscF/YscF/HrpA family type III secretion system needle major subunit [unclassified Herbaspirillum]|uniref:EscF/YscF/HrpA family type III secretion system needle major subunit n=1 Tax=unclassified Herbaspirillum TaxID=2624150 RepID=UPI00117207DB|nr:MULTISPECIES: EscF/YscF/HrpA family type III secretion system needle major subunit [unclassified Herbaspirillum]MBB5390588.1 type III secretion protein F [Herbaspirillum sp. SJZ102]TQK08924.1 type III secretion system major needle protein (YscF/MxiH/PrgI family) [Herbaspirillum sp. SJZ130]TQK14389.1 type III secretion system major needle protein (YscF/MxiH/PrgI family) [Herbaspirillum sp. SJZ106]TWC66595.1 type III secretion system major needle protein (YscF/MxiH/PrgI family) [Herbaspirillum
MADATTPYQGGGLMVETAESFEKGGSLLFAREKDLRSQLAGNGTTGSGSTDPALLAEYQAVISEVSILRNAQSSTVKAFKDTDATILANFR